MYVAVILFLLSIARASSNCPEMEPESGSECPAELDGLDCSTEVWGGSAECGKNCENGVWDHWCYIEPNDPPSCPEMEPESWSECPAELDGLKCTTDVWGGSAECGKDCENGVWAHWCYNEPNDPPTCPDTMPELQSACRAELDGLVCSEALWGGGSACEKICENGRWETICEDNPPLPTPEPTCPDTNPEAGTECPAELDGLECREALWDGDKYCYKVCESGEWVHICEDQPLPTDEPTPKPTCPDTKPDLMSACPSLEGLGCNDSVWGGDPICRTVCKSGAWVRICEDLTTCPDTEPELMSACPGDGVTCNDSVWGGDPTCEKICEDGQWAGICEGIPPLPTDEPTPEPTESQEKPVSPTDTPTDEPTDAPADNTTSSGDMLCPTCHFYYSCLIAAFLLSLVPGI